MAQWTTGEPLADPDDPSDTLFLNPETALTAARQARTLPRERIQSGVNGLQLCYALGAAQEVTGVPGFVPVPVKGMVGFFHANRRRAPTWISFDPADPAQRENAAALTGMIEKIYAARFLEGNALLARLRSQPLTLGPEEPLRVLLNTSRCDEDLRFPAEALARHFAARGCVVRTAFEDLRREFFDARDWIAILQQFHPHVVVTLNEWQSFWSHPQCVNVIWWQDVVGQLRETQPMAWRERDLHYSLHQALDGYLLKCGVPPERILRQPFCVDREVFHPGSGENRRRKVVFVGSSYARKGGLDEARRQDPGLERLLGEMFERLEAGDPLEDEVLQTYSQQFGYSFDTIFWIFLHYVVRDRTVQWLCRCADRIDVEIYGGESWLQDPTTAPFYKGLLPRGEAVAEVYRNARYALVSHPFDLWNLRLLEAAGCGCIPIVYDCRGRGGRASWEDSCLWFRTFQTLREQLTQVPVGDSRLVVESAGYDSFVDQILKEVYHMGF
ncbi:MAG: hypothetical protein HQL51_05655 [Magnetococcales bacterium]|nr:hypothetical protein [Magnetococcales bacterium]